MIRAAAVLLLVVFLALLGGCGDGSIDANKQGEATPEATQEEAAPPGILRLPLNGDLATIDPGLTEDTGSIEVVEQLFLGLTDFDYRNFEVLPELAERWEALAEGRVYRFYLRNDALWSNGEPVTAHDLVWALRRNIDPETRSPYAHLLYILENAKDIHEGNLSRTELLGVSAVDDYTVEFRLTEPAAYFPAMVGVWIYRPLPRATIERHGAGWTDPRNIVTNGSYLLAGRKLNKEVVLRKNPRYYDAARVAIPEVRYLVLTESSTGLLMYENNALDILGASYLPLPLKEIPRILADPVLSREYHNKPSLCTYYYGFNNRRAPLYNPLVRRAISAAVDRRLLIDVITRGEQEPAHTFTRPPIFGAVDPAEGVGIHFDPERARQWLAEAGFPGGKGFPELTLAYNTSETHAKVAQGIATLLEHHLHIRVTPKAYEWNEYMESLKQPNTPDLFKFGWCADYPDANNWLNEAFHPLNSVNRTGWMNEEFIDVVERASGETDPARRKELYRRAERILVEEEAAIMPIYFHTGQYLVKPRVKGWYQMPLGGQHIRNWSLQ